MHLPRKPRPARDSCGGSRGGEIAHATAVRGRLGDFVPLPDMCSKCFVPISNECVFNVITLKGIITLHRNSSQPPPTPHPPPANASLFSTPPLRRHATPRHLSCSVLHLFSKKKKLLKAGRLTVGAQKRVGHKDKRNLYLADEGLVLQDSGAAEGAAKSDMEKRVLARKDKKSKLKNPIFFVSPTRLSVRNLGRHVTDGKLKSMAAAAARAGAQAGRANPQDVRRYLEAQVCVCAFVRVCVCVPVRVRVRVCVGVCLPALSIGQNPTPSFSCSL